MKKYNFWSATNSRLLCLLCSTPARNMYKWVSVRLCWLSGWLQHWRGVSACNAKNWRMKQKIHAFTYNFIYVPLFVSLKLYALYFRLCRYVRINTFYYILYSIWHVYGVVNTWIFMIICQRISLSRNNQLLSGDYPFICLFVFSA